MCVYEKKFSRVIGKVILTFILKIDLSRAIQTN